MRISFTAAVLAAALSTTANAGTLVASGDEWTLSNNAYQGQYQAGTEAFAQALIGKFGGSNYLVLTGNANVHAAQLTSFTAQLQGAGKNVTQSSGIPLNLSAYDAVFHFGQIATAATFQSYVNGGGNAYISLGGGYYGNAAAEAANWNTMLATFGLVAGSSWFTAPGFVNAEVTQGPVGATNLIWGYGQSIERIDGTGGVSYIRGRFSPGAADIGLVGSSESLAAGVPEPATWLSLIVGFGATGAAMRRRRRVKTIVSFD